MRFEKITLPATDRENETAAALIEARQKMKRLKEEFVYRLEFPLEAFPQRLQNIIQVFHDCYGFPVDYYGLAMLTVSGGVLGNAYQAEYKYRWTAKPIIYGAIVGPSGIGKSHVLDMCFGPVYQLEDKFQAEHKIRMQEWEQQYFEYKNSTIAQKEPSKPPPREIMLEDSTMEAVYNSLRANPRGMLYFKDELSGWVDSMNKYRKGDDEQFWLSNWSNVSKKIGRVGKPPVFIRKPAISVIGALTPNFLKELASNGRADNGFLARILFAYPNDMDKPYESDILPDKSVFETYAAIMRYLYELPHYIKPEEEGDTGCMEAITLRLDEGAKAAFRAFLRANVDAVNDTDDDVIKSIYSKMDSYCLRFALILELLHLACDDFQADMPRYNLPDEITRHRITRRSVEAAIQITDYFKKAAFKVVERFDSPVNSLPVQKRTWYESLPDEFTTKTAVEIGISVKMSERTVKRLLNDKELFRKIARGEYEKLYI